MEGWMVYSSGSDGDPIIAFFESEELACLEAQRRAAGRYENIGVWRRTHHIVPKLEPIPAPR